MLLPYMPRPQMHERTKRIPAKLLLPKTPVSSAEGAYLFSQQSLKPKAFLRQPRVNPIQNFHAVRPHRPAAHNVHARMGTPLDVLTL